MARTQTTDDKFRVVATDVTGQSHILGEYTDRQRDDAWTNLGARIAAYTESLDELEPPAEDFAVVP